MAQNSVTVKAAGLRSFKNYLSEIPPGSLVRADNIIINRDGIMESRRGNAIYGTSFDGDSERAKQLLAYKGRILRHYADTLQFDSDGDGTFVSFTEPVTEVETGLRIKGVEQNGNFLFTTSDGIKKISVSSAINLAADGVVDAGAPKAITIRGEANTATPGFLEPTSLVAYRVVWGYKDANSNLIIGSPSNRLVVENTDAVLSAVVDLTILIPEGVTTAYFYQLYRTAITTSPVQPDEEYQLVLEANPTTAEIAAGSLMVTDITPEDFREGGAFLYTNPISGEGILQANERPPIAKDITTFKNFTFYANTSTRHKISLSLLSVDDFTAGVSKLIITDGITTEEYTFDVAENTATQTVELSTDPSVAIAVAETAQSLEWVINSQASGIVYAYYISGADDVPGQLLLERRDQTDVPFYLNVNDPNISEEWNPTLPLTLDITAISTGATPTITTSTPHDLVTGETVILYNTDSTPDVDGEWFVTVTGVDTFTITPPAPVTVVGTTGFVALLDTTSENEVAPNRLYFSKLQQPEAVPVVNFIDIGPKDQPILRILGLRDSLFVLKTDGIYQVSGNSPENFGDALFDSSTRIFAADSAVVLNNQIYVFTTQGVSTVSDTGVAIISRDIEDKLYKLVASQYTNSHSASFAVAYESDRCYLLWVTTLPTDEQATQCFRYNTFTQTWVRWPIEKTCGIVNSFGDDKLYLGAGDTNFIERERKDFGRYDYADRNILTTIPNDSIDGTLIDIGSTDDFSVGDALSQTQYVTISQYNRLLQKLDRDAQLSGGYVSNLTIAPGANMSNALTALVARLNSQDMTTVYTFSGTSDPATQQEEFNEIIDDLNASAGVNYTNYSQSLGSIIYDALVLAVDNLNINITINYITPFVAGDAFVYKSIEKTVDYAPMALGDPAMLKQVSESTMIFENSSIYGATLAYGSDLSKNYEPIDFLRSGNGQWGAFVWGNHTWGGEGTQLPMRTFIPQQKQRCRWINARFQHMFALENPAILGMSLSFENVSTRGYR